MSIKPIDYNVMLPKTQEISSAKYVESIKNRNIVDRGFIQQEKLVDRNKTKVMNTEKSNHSKISDNNKSRSQGDSKNKKQKKSKESLEQETGSNDNSEIGNNIDIRI